MWGSINTTLYTVNYILGLFYYVDVRGNSPNHIKLQS